MSGDWLADRRSEVAADRILDAAAHLFTRSDAASVGMNDVAKAAGCSRATLYRYFENRDALYTAYVHREARRVFRELGGRVAGIADPRERLVEGVLAALEIVRENPSLSSWFVTSARPIGGDMADRSEVIDALAASFLRSSGSAADDVERRARWLVRTMTSLLTFPGRDAEDERNMVADFVVPIVLPESAMSAPSSGGGAATPAGR
ncbi:TetR/AcrR family transcriptional regulator [Mycobacterium hodleri]|uniref:TetR/AcrR family transcriptional regulator n=1 Tax=Mycolicibacterium hodleri TaxID=49897 RepID=UPI0021F3729E|nr:TetR/AcrR family transcriptional regulator [Mycolicibacterium hodleri]MCV7133699.1 TetR/AcrR family transcriptional regulator [Mycolicibacterium hodleri]